MITIKSIGTIVVLLFLLSETLARPALKDKCARKKCSGKQNLALYEVGKTHTYSYQSIHNNDMADATEEKSSLKIEAKVKISVLSPCEMQLEMTDVKLSDAINTKAGEETKDYKMGTDMLQKVPIRFSLDNGKVSAVCPNKGENKFAANIKRSIISQFQNNMESLDSSTYVAETDVVGNCLTEYESIFVADADFRHINKKKAISGCSKKHEFSTMTNGQAYDMPLDVKKLSILDGSYECVIKQQYAGILKESKCTEIHKFNPMQASDDTINMKITTSLVHEKTATSENVTPADPEYMSDLLFDHNPVKVVTKGGELDAVLKSLCNSIKTKEENIPKDFSDLLDLMKEMSVDQLNKLHDKIMEGFCDDDLMKSMFHDAISIVQTDSSIQLMMNELKESEEHKFSRDAWLASLSLIRRPSLKMIKSSLDGVVKTDNKALIMASNMIKKYCSLDPACSEKTEVQEFVNYVKSRIVECDTTDAKKVEDILSALRAVDNMGGIQVSDKTLSQKILTCKGNDQLQSAAMISLQTINCEKLDLVSVADLFLDKYSANEARIKAYKVLMRCEHLSPVEDFVKDFNSDNADSAQVASFVHSHLMNTLQISDSSNAAKQAFIGRIKIAKFGRRAAKSPFSFSQNIRRDFRFRKSKANVEADVIFADESYIPRTVAVNITMDMWGQKVNVLDMNLRQEGFETYVEKLLSYYNQESGKEEYKNKYNKFDKDVLKWLGKKSNSPKLSIGARIFGNEMVFKNNMDVNSMQTTMNMKLLNLMSNGLTGKSSRTTKMLDLAISTPTVSGIPLELKVDGILSSKMEYNIKLSQESVMKIVPRVSLRVVGTFRLNAHCTKIGVQATLTTLVNRNMDMKMAMNPKNGGMSITFEQAAVDKRQDFINLKAELSHITNKGVKPMAGKGEKVSVNQCTSDVMYEKMDLRYCVAYTHPRADKKKGDPGFPFAGPTNVQIYVEKHSGLTFEMNREMPNGDSQNKLFFVSLGNMKNRESILLKYQFTKSADAGITYLWKINGMGGSYELSGAIDKSKLSGTYKRNNEVAASLNGQFGGGKKNRHFSFQVDKDKKKIGSVEYRSKRMEKGQSDHFEAEITTYFPMQLSLKRITKTSKSAESVFDKVMNNYVMDVTLGKIKPHQVKASINMVNEKAGQILQQVVKYFWKSGDTIILDVKNDFKLKSFQAKGKDDNSINGRALEMEITHQTKRPEKIIKFSFSTSFFVSSYLLMPSIRQPKLFEHSTKITFPDDPKNKMEYNFIAKMKVPNKKLVDIKLASTASWPKMNVDQNHLALLNWNLQDSSKVLNIELKCQPAKDRKSRVYLKHGTTERGIETTLGFSVRKTKLTVHSLFAQPKHTLTITQNKKVIVLTSTANVKTLPKQDNRPEMIYYDIMTDITKNDEDIAKQQLGIGIDMKQMKGLKVEYNLKKLKGGEKLMTKINIDLNTNMLRKYKKPSLNALVNVQIPELTDKIYDFKFVYSCENKDKCKLEDIITILKGEEVVKKYGYTHEYEKKGRGSMEYEAKVYTGNPNEKEEFSLETETKRGMFESKMKLKLTKYGEYKVKSKTNTNRKRYEVENKITIKSINSDSPYNGVYKESAILDINSGLKLDYTFEFMPTNSETSYKLTSNIKIYKRQDNWNEIMFTFSPTLSKYVAFQKAGLRFKPVYSPTMLKLDMIAVYRGLDDKSDKSISCNLNAEASRNYKLVNLGVSLNSTIEATQFKTVLVKIGYEFKKKVLTITANGQFDNKFLNFEISNTPKFSENGVGSQKLNMLITSSIEAIQKIESSLLIKLNLQESIKFILDYNRNTGMSTVNSDLTINWRTRPLSNLNVGLVFGWTAKLYGNGKIDIGSMYNAESGSHKLKTNVNIILNEFNFKSGFDVNATLGSTVTLSYALYVQSQGMDFMAKGSAKAISGIPLETVNEVTLNNKQLFLFQFTVLKVLSVDFKLNVGQNMPEFSIKITGQKFKSDDLDVEITIGMKPIIKRMTQKIVYYNKVGGSETMTLDGKKASFYIKFDTNTEYTDFSKLAVSALLTENMQVHGTIEANAAVLGPPVELTTITIDGLKLEKNQISAVMKIKGTLQYDVAVSYKFKSLNDMNADVTITSDMETAPIKKIEATYSADGYNINILVNAQDIVKFKFSTTGDSWRNMKGNVGLSVMTPKPAYSATFEFLFPKNNKADKVFKIEGFYPDSQGKSITFKYDRVLSSLDSTRTPGKLRRELTIDCQYGDYPTIKLIGILDGGLKNPFAKLTLDFKKPEFAVFTIDIMRKSLSYLVSVNIDSMYNGDLSFKKLNDNAFKLSINSNGFENKGLTGALSIEQKVSEDFLTTIIAESDYLIGLLNNNNKKRVVTTTIGNVFFSPMSSFAALDGKIFYFYIDNDFQVELTKTAKYGGSLMIFPKFTDKDKTTLSAKLDVESETKTLTISLTSPYQPVEQLEFITGYKGGNMGEALITSSLIYNNNFIYDASVGQTVKAVENEKPQIIHAITITGYITVTINQEIRMINPFRSSRSPLPVFKQDVDVDFSNIMPDLKFKRSLLFINYRKDSMNYNKQATYKFENTLRELLTGYQFTAERSYAELSLDKRRDLTLLVDKTPTKLQLKTLVRTIDMTMSEDGNTIVFKTYNNKKSPQGSATFTFTKSPGYKGKGFEGTLTSSLFNFPLVVSVTSTPNKVLLTIKKEGQEPAIRFQIKNKNNVKAYTDCSLEIDVNIDENKKFIKYRGEFKALKSRIVKLSQKIKTQSGSREFSFVYDPWRQLLITDNDLYRLELFYNRDYKGITNKAVAIYKPQGLTYQRITTFTYSPWRFSNVINSDIGDMKFYVRALNRRMYNMELVRVKPTGEVISDITWNAKLDEKNLLTLRLFTSPTLIKDLKNYLKEIYNPYRLTRVRQYWSEDITSANGKLFTDLRNPFEGQDKLVQYFITIYADYTSLNHIFLRMYANDEFFIRTVWGVVKPVHDSIIYQIQMSMMTVPQFASTGGLYGQVYKLGKMIVSAIPDDLHLTYLKLDFTFTTTVIQKFYQACDKVAKMATSGSGKVKSLMSALMERLQFLRDRKMPEWMVEHRAYIRKNYEKAIEELANQDFKEFYEAEMNPTMNRYKEFREGMVNVKKNVRKLGKWIRGYVAKRSGMKQRRQKMRQYYKMISNGQFTKLMNEILKPELFTNNFDETGINYDLDIYISPQLIYLMKKSIKMKIYIAKRLFSSASQLRGGLVANVYYKLRYYLSNYGTKQKIIENLLPPYKQQAWLILGKDGRQNSYQEVISFNGRIKTNLAQVESCKLLLTRNAFTKDFTVIYSTGDSSVLVQNPSSSAEVKISLDGKVYVGADTISLPQRLNNLLVTRDGQRIRVADTISGALVDIYTKLKFVKVEVPGMWHAQMIGLMGTNDYNVFRDYLKPSGQSAGIDLDLWALSDNCVVTRNPVSQAEVFPSRVLKKVQASVGRCFPVINPRPYLSAGKRLATYGMATSDALKRACPIINAYTLRCREAGIAIYSPPICKEKCQLNKKPVKEGQKSMLYIFVIEESSCMTSYKQQIKDLTTVLTKRRNSDVFSLITYQANRKGSSTYISPNGQYIFNKEDMLMIIENLDLPSQFESGPGTVEALYNALMFPVENGRMHSVFLFSCAPCMRHSSYTSGVLMGLMRRKKIHFQFFSTAEYGTNIIGIGPNVAYKLVDNKVVKDSSIYGLTSNNDVCSSVARTVGGGVSWSIRYMMTSKLPSSVLYENVVNAAIGGKFFTKYSARTQRCSCIRDPYGSMQESCNF